MQTLEVAALDASSVVEVRVTALFTRTIGKLKDMELTWPGVIRAANVIEHVTDIRNLAVGKRSNLIYNQHC